MKAKEMNMIIQTIISTRVRMGCIAVGALASFVSVGCSATSAEPSLERSVQIRAAQQSAQIGTPTSGGALATAYRFPLEGTIQANDLGEAMQYAGDNELLTYYYNTGTVSGVSKNASAQVMAGFPATAAQHDSMALAYISSLGIPSGEVGPSYSIREFLSGAAAADPSNIDTQPQGFKTNFTRVVNGFQVMDSHAAVKLNVNGVPIDINIQWPTIPASVLADATSLQQSLSQGFVTPAGVTKGLPITRTRVVLRHSIAGRASLIWRASIRAEMRGGKGRTHVDMDATGTRIEDFDLPGTPSTR